MNEPIVFFLYKLRFIFVGIFISAGLFLCTLLWSAIGVADASSSLQSRDETPSVSFAAIDDSPNVVTGGMSEMAEEVGQSLDTAGQSLDNGLRSVATAAAGSGKFVTQGGKRVALTIGSGVTFAARGVGRGIAFTAHTAVSGLTFVLRAPGNVLGYASNTAVANALIKPADHAPVPIIDPHSPALHAARTAMETTSQTTPQADSAAGWPIHGDVTTKFGVAHWPFQRVHTGLDISSGRPSGTTPVKPFKPGKVIETVRSNRGLGNHVIVDHGEGVTSVYAHLASISVSVGQDVDKNTQLGTEGSTGVSTGTHLHFEIRVNGQAANPPLFIGGQPRL